MIKRRRRIFLYYCNNNSNTYPSLSITEGMKEGEKKKEGAFQAASCMISTSLIETILQTTILTKLNK